MQGNFSYRCTELTELWKVLPAHKIGAESGGTFLLWVSGLFGGLPGPQVSPGFWYDSSVEDDNRSRADRGQAWPLARQRTSSIR